MSRRLLVGRPLPILASALVAAMALSGCVSARNALGTSSSPCFKAVPVASDAVHDHGTLAGIRLFSGSQIDRYLHLRQVLEQSAGGPVTQVCVASFHGQYSSSDVSKPLGRAVTGSTGKVAVVFVAYPANKLLGTLVLSREPLPLRHVVLGVPPSPVRARPPAT